MCGNHLTSHGLDTISRSQVINPLETTVCHGGQPCPVQWLDDGEQPLLTTMGPCHVSLYAENEVRLYVHSRFSIWANVTQILIQQIEPVDVSTTHSLTFTVKPISCLGIIFVLTVT